MYRDVRIREANNKLVFRFDPSRDVVEVSIHGQRYTVDLENYRRDYAESLTFDSERTIISDRGS